MKTLFELCAESGELAVDSVPEAVRNVLVEKLYNATLPRRVLAFIRPLLLGQATQVETEMPDAKARLDVQRYAEAMGLRTESTPAKAAVPEGAGGRKRKRVQGQERNSMTIKVTLNHATFRYKRIPSADLAKFRADDRAAERSKMRKLREDVYKEECNECGGHYFTSSYEVRIEGDTTCPHCGHDN